MGHADDICYGILTAYAIPGVHGPIGAFSILLVVLFLINAGVMVYWVQRQVQLAKQGVEGAVRHVRIFTNMSSSIFTITSSCYHILQPSY